MVATPIDVNLTHQQILALGSQMTQGLGLLSPLKPKSAEQQAMAGERVISPELVGADGRLRTELLPAFNTLSNPQAYVLLAYLGRSFLLETTYYYPDARTSKGSVSLTDTDEGLKLSAPGVKEGVFELLRQYIGETVLRHLDFEYSLPLIDTWVLFATIDACRRKMLKSVLENEYSPQVQLMPEEVYESISVRSNNMQWFSPYFGGCLSLVKLSQRDLQIGIQNLQEKGLLRLHDGTVFPEDVLLRIADEFLVIDAHIRLRSGMLKGEKPEHVDMRALQGRSGAIMFWSYDEQAVDLIAFSPAQLMFVISSLIENPAEHLSGAVQPSQPPERLP